MPNSLTFDDVYLGDYGLRVLDVDLPMSNKANPIQLSNKSYASDSNVMPKPISLSILVVGSDSADLLSKLDNIKKTLNCQFDKALVLDFLNDRYWSARFDSLTGRHISSEVFKGVLDFICYDPYSYGLAEIEIPYDIDGDPKQIITSINGTASTDPVYTLTAGENLVAATIELLNGETATSITWTGNVDNGEHLKIDCRQWFITLNDIVNMATMTGNFPKLVSGENLLRISGFGALGTLSILYKPKYV